MKAPRARWSAVIWVIADLPGRQRRGDLAQQGFHQRRQLLLLCGNRRPLIRVHVEQVSLSTRGVLLHAWLPPSLSRIGESLEARRPQRVERAGHREKDGAQRRPYAVQPIRASSTRGCRRPIRRAAE